MSRKNRYKIKIIKADKSTSYKQLIGQEFYLTTSQVRVHSEKYYLSVGPEDAYLFYKSDVWLIDTQRPELSQSIYFPDDIADRAKVDKLFEEIKRMNLFKEIWYLCSTHWASQGLWIEFGNEEKVKKDFHGYTIEHYVKEN